MKYRKTKIVIVLSIVCSVLMFLSYRNARNIAHEIFKPFLEDDLYYYGTSFHPVMFLEENNEIQEWWGPSWYVSYDAQTDIIVQPFSIRINLLGKIIATNPNNLMEEIIPKYLNTKLKKQNLTMPLEQTA
jgi:hypothetical protein